MVYLSPELDATFAALADPTRRAMMERLAAGDCTISELASGFAMTLPAVSKHVRVLERAGLAMIRQEGRSRWCTLVAAPMQAAAAWMDRYRVHWETSLDRLAQYLEETREAEEATWRTQDPGRGSGSGSRGGSGRRGSGSTGRGRKRKR